MKRYDIDYGYFEESSNSVEECQAIEPSQTGEWVCYEEAQALLAEKDAEIARLDTGWHEANLDILNLYKQLRASNEALIAIHNKLEYGDVYQWDDGDECWQKMREVVAKLEGRKYETL